MAPRHVTAALAALLCAAASVSASTLTASVNATTGSFSVLFDGVNWFDSDAKSGGLGLLVGGTALNPANGGLKLLGVTPISGSSLLGPYTGVELRFDGGVQGGSVLARFKSSALPRGAAALMCELELVAGLAGSGKTVRAGATDLTAGFPVFATAPAVSDRGYLTWTDDFAGAHVGTWDAASNAALGYNGGPVALFNGSLATIVTSAASHYMVGGLAFPSWAGPKSLSGGLFAALSGVPAGTVHSTLLVAGSGIGDTMRAWGDALLTLGGKARTPLQRDVQTAYLSYWTDNGAA